MKHYVGGDRERNRLRLTLIACWLLADPGFADLLESRKSVRRFLESGLTEMAALVDAPQFVTEPDRREELARFTLARLELIPAGEGKAQALDRLTTLSSVERERVLKRARAEQKRARKVREELARKAREAAAPGWTRE